MVWLKTLRLLESSAETCSCKTSPAFSETAAGARVMVATGPTAAAFEPPPQPARKAQRVKMQTAPPTKPTDRCQCCMNPPRSRAGAEVIEIACCESKRLVVNQ